MSTTLLIVQTLNGLQLGVLLFLIAAGLTLVFGVMHFINLARARRPLLCPPPSRGRAAQIDQQSRLGEGVCLSTCATRGETPLSQPRMSKFRRGLSPHVGRGRINAHRARRKADGSILTQWD